MIQEVLVAVDNAEAYERPSRRVVLLVTLDVRNAFNSARWVDMLEGLDHFRVPGYLLNVVEDYLRERTPPYETKEGPRSIVVTASAAKGSVLGPDLWNVAYDGLLREELPDETCLVGYVDDVPALIVARNVEQVQLKLNQVMRTKLVDGKPWTISGFQ